MLVVFLVLFLGHGLGRVFRRVVAVIVPASFAGAGAGECACTRDCSGGALDVLLDGAQSGPA